jgi:hypothetical protein
MKVDPARAPLLLSPSVASLLKAAGVNRDNIRVEAEASDHAPSWIELVTRTNNPKRNGGPRVTLHDPSFQQDTPPFDHVGCGAIDRGGAEDASSHRAGVMAVVTRDRLVVLGDVIRTILPATPWRALPAG